MNKRELCSTQFWVMVIDLHLAKNWLVAKPVGKTEPRRRTWGRGGPERTQTPLQMAEDWILDIRNRLRRNSSLQRYLVW